MTIVEQVEVPSPLSPRQKAMLLSVVALVAVLVGGVCAVVWFATSPKPTVSASGAPLTAECRAAVLHAKAADRKGSSAEAIKAATQMLRTCQS